MSPALTGFSSQGYLQTSIGSVKKLWKKFNYVPARKRGIDPVGEAEVFLAYGRHDDAIFVLKDALKTEADNLAAKLTLLRAYYYARNIRDYASLASSIQDQVQHLIVWKTVCDAGRQLDPCNPIFH